MALIYFCLRQQIRLCAKLFKVSAESLEDNWVLIPFKAFLGLMTTAMKGALLVLPLYMILGEGYYTPNPAYPADPTAAPCSWGPAQCTADGDCTRLWAYVSVFLFAFGWFAFWALETRTYIVADMTAHWYWHGKADGALGRAVHHGLVTHFGSMAFAGLVMWFVEQCKSIVRRAEGGKGCVQILCCVLKCLIMMCLNYLEFLCKMSVVMIGITGKSDDACRITPLLPRASA